MVQYTKALVIHPEYASARNNLANILLRQGKIDAALEQYEALLLINPRYAQGVQ